MFVRVCDSTYHYHRRPEADAAASYVAAASADDENDKVLRAPSHSGTLERLNNKSVEHVFLNQILILTQLRIAQA